MEELIAKKSMKNTVRGNLPYHFLKLTLGIINKRCAVSKRIDN